MEPERRGPYGGAVGYISAGAKRMDLAITIRTCVIADGVASVQSAAGIVLRLGPRAGVPRAPEQGARAADGDRPGPRSGLRPTVALTPLATAAQPHIFRSMPFKLISTDGDAVLRAAATACRSSSGARPRATSRSSIRRSRGATPSSTRRRERHRARPRLEQRHVRERRARRRAARARRRHDHVRQSRFQGCSASARRRRRGQRTDAPTPPGATIVRQLPGARPEHARRHARVRSRACRTEPDSPASSRSRSTRAGRSSRRCSRSRRDSARRRTSTRCSTRSSATPIRFSRSTASRSSSSTSAGELVPKIRARQARRRHAARRCRSRSRARALERQGRDPLRQRRRGHALRRPVDPHAADSLGDLRAAHRQRGPRARRAVRRQRRRRRTASATTTSSSASRSPASRPSRSRTAQFAQRIQRELVTRSNFERFFTPQLAQADRRVVGIASGSAATSGRRRAVQRHPRLHRALRDDAPGRHGEAAHRVLHRDGGVRVPPRRHARQVHRRRRDGAVGRADRRRPTTPTRRWPRRST